MPEYRRNYIDGGTYFFTVVSYQRRPLFDNEDKIDLLRDCFKNTMGKYPFTIEAIAILPEHIHTIWTLPENDHDYSTRWRMIKSSFSRKFRIADSGNCYSSLIRKGEKGVWQRRFWEHTIRNQEDFNRHCDYIHYNPVKHNLADIPCKWQHSSFTKFVEQGMYDINWGRVVDKEVLDMNLE